MTTRHRLHDKAPEEPFPITAPDLLGNILIEPPFAAMVRYSWTTHDSRLKATYDAAMTTGLWKGKYPSVNHHEYFAEGVQPWFDNNRENAILSNR